MTSLYFRITYCLQIGSRVQRTSTHSVWWLLQTSSKLIQDLHTQIANLVSANIGSVKKMLGDFFYASSLVERFVWAVGFTLLVEFFCLARATGTPKCQDGGLSENDADWDWSLPEEVRRSKGIVSRRTTSRLCNLVLFTIRGSLM